VEAGRQRPPGREPGLFGSLRALLDTLLAAAHTRLELLGVEVREELVRLALASIWSLVALFFAGLGVALVVLAVVAAFWATHPVLVVTLLAAGFFILAALALRAALSLLREKPRLFDATLSEIERDRAHLQERR